MKSKWYLVLVALSATFGVACGDDGGDEMTSSGDSTSSSSAAAGGAAAGQGGASTGTAGSGGQGTGGDDFACSTVRKTALGAVDKTSDAEVTVLETNGGTSTVFVDASAGGFQQAANNPAVYLDLAKIERVGLTDLAAFESSSWDLAIKRVGMRNNSVHAGPGDGGAAFLAGADFDAVSASDAMSAMMKQEQWFDDNCDYAKDLTGSLVTSMSDWYDYAAMVVTPKNGVFVVRGADGASYFKVQVLDYYSNPDGTKGQSSGRYLLKIASL